MTNALTRFAVAALFLGAFIPAESVVCAERAEPGDKGDAVVNAAEFAGPESPTGGLQEAVDALPASGGVVNVPAGQYVLRQCIQVRSQVTLQGVGGSAVLRSAKQAVSRLAAPADRGATTVRVVDAGQFRELDEVGLKDKDSVGWNIAHAIVKGIKGDELLLDRRLPRAFDPAKDGVVFAGFPAITGNNISQVVIRDLVIDGHSGNEDKPTTHVDPGFTFAAIHLVEATDSRVDGCWIRDWSGDGVSLQRGAGNAVLRCRIQNCRGNGLHPGGGLRDSTFSENVVRGCGGEGLYFCAGVRHVVVSGNIFTGNKGNGIGALGDNGDKYNIVANNVCETNGGSGIWLFDGDSNTVSNNICVNNAGCGILLNRTADTIVQGNRCLDDRRAKTQKHGVFEYGSCRSNLFANNLCRGNAQAGLVLEGKDSQSSGNRVVLE